MKLRKLTDLAMKWRYAQDQGATVVLMRHAPKAGSDKSDLSPVGEKLARKYGNFTRILWQRYVDNASLVCTSKSRSQKTLKLLFPDSDPNRYCRFKELEYQGVSDSLQEKANQLHAEVGCQRGYFLNHTYYFMSRFGVEDDSDLHGKVAERMAKGIKRLFANIGLTIYCGHSPAIEVGLEKLLGIPLTELGGFLNPLDSIHLKIVNGQIEFVSRINPIIGFVDSESEEFSRRCISAKIMETKRLSGLNTT